MTQTPSNTVLAAPVFTTGTAPGTYATAVPVRETIGGLTLVQLHDSLARVTRPNGEVVGYVETFQHEKGLRYRAKRFLPRQRRFVEIGEFWSRVDATDCFRFN